LKKTEKSECMDKNIFTDKKEIPDDKKLAESLGNVYPLWNLIKDYAHLKYPKAMDEWHFTGEKFGWGFRVKDKKRAILYFLPYGNFFKVALVFGQKAMDEIMKSSISDPIKKELEAARVYAEGRGIRIEVKDESVLSDIKALIDIKIAN
jgi:hypothetical protein